jgi:hypothetical protein
MNQPDQEETGPQDGTGGSSGDQESPDAPGRRRWWPIAAAAVAIAIAASLLFPAGRHQWALSIIRQPARYTALSFRYAWLLPTSNPSSRTFPLFFTIRNEEGHALNYHYILRETDILGSRTLSTGGQTITAGATWYVDTKVRPTCSVSPCRVEVLLPGHAETIDFFLTVTAAVRPHKRKPSARHAHQHHSPRS